MFNDELRRTWRFDNFYCGKLFWGMNVLEVGVGSEVCCVAETTNCPPSTNKQMMCNSALVPVPEVSSVLSKNPKTSSRPTSSIAFHSFAPNQKGFEAPKPIRLILLSIHKNKLRYSLLVIDKACSSSLPTLTYCPTMYSKLKITPADWATNHPIVLACFFTA